METIKLIFAPMAVSATTIGWYDLLEVAEPPSLHSSLGLGTGDGLSGGAV